MNDKPVAPKKRKRPSVRQRGNPRKRTIAPKRLTRLALIEEWANLGLHTEAERKEVGADRPRTWGDCQNTIYGACPYVGCKHHLFLDVNPETGSITFNFPDLEVWEIPHVCSLREAQRGGLTLEEVGERMNITRERVRQIEVRALYRKLRPAAVEAGMDGGDVGLLNKQSALADAEDIEFGVRPSDVSFQSS